MGCFSSHKENFLSCASICSPAKNLCLCSVQDEDFNSLSMISKVLCICSMSVVGISVCTDSRI